MKILEGKVEYKDRTKDNPIICLYGVTEEGKTYYFLPIKQLVNGNRVVSPVLVEAIDPQIKAGSIGVLSEQEVEVIPCTNSKIVPITDEVLMVEPANPVSESIIEANNLRSDPNNASQLVSRPAIIKDKIKEKAGNDVTFIYNNQLSGVMIIDIDGNLLVEGEYSFLGIKENKLYLAKNIIDTDVKVFNLETKSLEQEDVVKEEVQNIDVNQVEVPMDVVENAVSETVPTEEVVETPVQEETSVEPVQNEVPQDMSYEVVETPAQEENINQGFNMEDVQAMPLSEEQMVENNNIDEIGEEIKVPTEEIVETPVVDDTSIQNEEQQDMSYEVVETPAKEENVEEETSVDEYTNPSFDFTVEDIPEKEIEEDNNDFPEENIDVDDKVEESDLDNYFKDYSKIKTDKIEDYDIDYTVNDDFDNTKMYQDNTNGKARIIKGLIEKVHTTTAEKEDLVRQNEELRREIENAKRENENKSRESEELRRALKKAEGKNDILKEENDMLIAKNRSQTAQIKKLEAKNERLMQENDAIDMAIEEGRNILEDSYHYTR